MKQKSTLNVQNKQVVVPGEILATGMEYLPSYGTYRREKDIIASRLGLVILDGKVIKLIPLSGKYLPKQGDVIIGKVTDVTISGWRVDTNSAYSALLSMKEGSTSYIKRGEDLTKYLAIGDYIVTKIINVTSQNLIDLTLRGPGMRKLDEGRIILVNPSKVPRIIGKQGSMVTMIKKETDCNIMVGQNGVVWIRGSAEKEIQCVKTIRKIEQESHIPGLTEKINTYLQGEMK